MVYRIIANMRRPMVLILRQVQVVNTRELGPSSRAPATRWQ